MGIEKTKKVWIGVVLVAIAIGATAWWWGCGGSGSGGRTGSLIVTSIEKGTVTTLANGAGAITVTVNFDPTTPVQSDDLSNITITVADASGLGTTPLVSNLSCPVGGLQCTADVSQLGGCMSFADYTVTVTIGTDVYTGTFNAADDEFNWTVAVDDMIQGLMLSESFKISDITKCWIKNVGPFVMDGVTSVQNSVTVDPTAGQMTVHFAGTANSPFVFLEKGIDTNSSANKATLYKYSSTNVPHGQANVSSATGFMDILTTTTTLSMFMGGGGNVQNMSGTAVSADGLFFMGISTSSLVPLLLKKTDTTYDAGYMCSIWKDGAEKAFYSADGVTFSPMDATWMSPIIPVADASTPSPSLAKASGGGELDLPPLYLSSLIAVDAAISGENPVLGDPAFTSIFDFVRYRTTGITGTSADCLSLMNFGVTKTQ